MKSMEYYILTNAIEIELNQLIGSLSNSNATKRTNDLYVFLDICDILSENDENVESKLDLLSDITTLLESDEISNFPHILEGKNTDKYWDSLYTFNNLPQYINSIKNYLGNEYDEVLFLEVIKEINNTLNYIKNTHNVEKEENYDNVKERIETIMSEYPKFESKYSEAYEEAIMTNNFDDTNKENNNIVKMIAKALKGNENIVEPSEEDKYKYKIYVGNKKVNIDNKIKSLVKDVNTLYRKLILEDNFIIQYLYALAAKDFAQMGEYSDKTTELTNKIQSTPEYNELSEENKAKILSYIPTMDNDYIYSEDEISTLTLLVEKSNNWLNKVKDSNNQINEEITDKLSKLDQAKEEYKDSNNGEEYPNEIVIDDNVTSQGNTIYIDNINDILIKEETPDEPVDPQPEEPIESISSITGEHNITVGEQYEYTIQWTDNIVPSSDDLLEIHLDNNMQLVSKNVNSFTIIANAVGTYEITVYYGDKGFSLEGIVAQNSEPTPEQSFKFYFGSDASLYENDSTIFDSTKLVDFTELDDILGNYAWTGDCWPVLLLPTDMVNEIDIIGQQLPTNQIDEFNNQKQLEFNNIEYSLYAMGDPKNLLDNGLSIVRKGESYNAQAPSRHFDFVG